jgi:hypothetical protein
MTVRPVRSADSEDQSPLSKQRPIGREERIPGIVDAGRFRASAIELHDLEVLPLFEIFVVGEANVVPSNKKPGEPLGNLIDYTPECLRMKMHSITENAALRVIASFDQF